MKNTTQRMDEETLERLRDHGRAGDSFNEVLNGLLDRIDDIKDELKEHREDINELQDDEDEEN